MHLSIAPADFDSWHDLMALLQESFAFMEGRIDPPSSLARMAVDDLVAKAKDETLILATEGPNLIGCAFASVRRDCVYVSKVAVAHNARRKGIARELMAAADRVAQQNGRQFLELQTRVELIENHKTFAALGFEKIAETAHPGYNRPTSITMRRRVPAGSAR